jgi:hypothetical protein
MSCHSHLIGDSHIRGTLPGWLTIFNWRCRWDLLTREWAVDWTTNVAERGAKAAKRHQAVPGYWHTLTTPARWCRVRSYLDSAAGHGLTTLEAITAALSGRPWLPVVPAAA